MAWSTTEARLPLTCVVLTPSWTQAASVDGSTSVTGMVMLPLRVVPAAPDDSEIRRRYVPVFVVSPNL